MYVEDSWVEGVDLVKTERYSFLYDLFSLCIKLSFPNEHRSKIMDPERATRRLYKLSEVILHLRANVKNYCVMKLASERIMR